MELVDILLGTDLNAQVEATDNNNNNNAFLPVEILSTQRFHQYSPVPMKPLG